LIFRQRQYELAVISPKKKKNRQQAGPSQSFGWTSVDEGGGGKKGEKRMKKEGQKECLSDAK